ncbi:MAG: YdeI/OmpD-associated family protein [Chloroflexi bacterium]|nr:YdeI/OmpD-associated family protein [Chloroflexota bacterium]
MKTDPVVPDDLPAALTQQPELKTRFEALSPSHQREHINWIEEAKRPATRARRVESVIASLQSI